MNGKCDCGSVLVTIRELPDEINACPCSFCKRVGAHWGYFPAGTVVVKGATQIYRRESRIIEFHRCANCGVITHWQDSSGRVPHMGVHMKNFDPDVTSAIPVVSDP
jgi:hypothetical protein